MFAQKGILNFENLKIGFIIQHLYLINTPEYFFLLFCLNMKKKILENCYKFKNMKSNLQEYIRQQWNQCWVVCDLLHFLCLNKKTILNFGNPKTGFII